MSVVLELDDPPKSRAKMFAVGVLVAVPILGVFVGVLLPKMVGIIVGGSRDLDDQLQRENIYLRELCTTDMGLPGSSLESLCGCVMSNEHPSLDCHRPYRLWLLPVQHARCQDDATRKQSLSFCTCVNELQTTGDAEQAPTAYDRCAGLPDALGLPPKPS